MQIPGTRSGDSCQRSAQSLLMSRVVHHALTHDPDNLKRPSLVLLHVKVSCEAGSQNQQKMELGKVSLLPRISVCEAGDCMGVGGVGVGGGVIYGDQLTRLS